MKMILLNLIYLSASVVVSVYDAIRAIYPAADEQDKKGSSDNARFKKKILQVYPPKKTKK